MRRPDRVGFGERRHLPGHLAGHPEHLPAGGQQAQPRGGLEKLIGEFPGRGRHVLAVVQDQQPIQVGRVPVERFGRRIYITLGGPVMPLVIYLPSASARIAATAGQRQPWSGC